MVGPFKPRTDASAAQIPGATRRAAIGLLLGAPLLSACGSMQQFSNPFASSESPGPAGPPQQPAVAGNGQVKVGLLLPLSASGNAGVAAQSMKNAGECLQRAEGDVAEIADRGRDKVKAGDRLGCGKNVTADRKVTRPGFRPAFGIYRGCFCAHNA